MLTAKNISKNLKVNKKAIKYKKTASSVPLLKHNGTGLIKEQEASYVTSDARVTISRTFKQRAFYSPSEIIAIFKSKKIDKEWSFIEYKPSDTSKLTHCYHRYPAKFIPQLVERLFDEYLIGIKEPHANDLFMGSGTTIACAITKEYRADSNHIMGAIN